MQSVVDSKERSKQYTRLIELEIRNFYRTKRELALYFDINSRGRSSASLLHMERITHAIERAIGDTRRRYDGCTRMQMVQMKYWEGQFTDQGIMLQLHIGRSTFYKWRRQFIQLVADYMGYRL